MIAVRFSHCYYIDDRLIHGYRCACQPRDLLLRLLNMPGAE